MNILKSFLVACTALSAEAAELHISPAGNDANPGTASAPFATLERARTAVRALSSPTERVNVWLHGGIYTRTNTFELGTADSGTAGAPITWRGVPGEDVRVVGATKLEPRWFSEVSNTSKVWNRIDPAARGKLMQVDLLARGIPNLGTLQDRGFWVHAPAALELFFNHAPMPLARWPDPNEHTPPQTITDAQLTLFGNPTPTVRGRYTTNGISDGVSSFQRNEPIGEKCYHLYRHSWQQDLRTYTAWFLTTATTGYPPNTDPWWYRYAENLGPMAAVEQSGATGTVHFSDPDRLFHGFAQVDTALSDTAFTYAGSRPERWSQAEEPWFHGYWHHLWAEYYKKSIAIDTATKTITLDSPPNFGILGGQLFYALNLLEEITRPGEWYLNRDTGILYFWPPASLADADIFVSQIEEPLWEIKEATDLTVRDLTIEMGRTDLVVIEGGARCTLLHCTLRNAGNTACRISGTHNGISGCTVLDAGDSGVMLYGGHRPTLTPGNNFVINSTIERFSRWRWTYQPGVWMMDQTVGNLVSHNLIRNAPHNAILFSRGNNHRIEFNEISDVCQWASDAGAVYAGRDLGARGNLIRWNFIHDIDSPFDGLGEHGIYLDDMQCGTHLFGNVLYNISGFAIQIGGGRDNRAENNIIARCGSGLAVDSRGTGWAFRNNGSSNLWNLLQGYPYQATIWSNAYPACAAIPNQWNTVTNGTWLHPEGNVFSRNIGFENNEWTHEWDHAIDWFAETHNNRTNTNPLFIDEAHLNLALQSNSPAFSIEGFQPIPFDQIGLESNADVE